MCKLPFKQNLRNGSAGHDREGKLKKLLVLLALLAITGTAFAGFSLGYKPLDLPTYVYGSGSGMHFSAENMNLLRIGWGASPDFRIEILAGYDKVTWEVDTLEASGSNFAMGASAFYVIAAPSNTVFSIGGSFLYNKSTGEYDNTDNPETTGYSFYPLMRIDFAIPGAERFALFTEFGGRYVSATTDYTSYEAKATEFSTWGSEHILGGAYYSF
jgi:hypothetical protein